MPSSATGPIKMRTTFWRYHCLGDYQVALGIVSDPVHRVDLGAVGFVYASDFTMMHEAMKYAARILIESGEGAIQVEASFLAGKSDRNSSNFALRRPCTGSA
jgi:hypothetical protein